MLWEQATYYSCTDRTGITSKIGSSSFITDANGEAYQFLQYLPFGESFISQRLDEWKARYTFSAKEKDEATGYHYFGARYYDSETSVWLSVDPMSDEYPSMSPYNYCAGNPVMLIDQDGRSTDEWEINLETGDVKHTGDKGGETTQHITFVKNDEELGKVSYDVDKGVMESLKKQMDENPSWKLVGMGGYAEGSFAGGPGAAASVGEFSIFSIPDKEYTYTDVGSYNGVDLGVGAGLIFIIGPEDLKPGDLHGFSLSLNGGIGYVEAGIQTSATREGYPTWEYLIVNVGAALSIPGGGLSPSKTSVKEDKRNNTLNSAGSYWDREFPICFAKGTEVYTNKGFIEIQNLQIGDSLYSYDFGSKKIKASIILKTYNFKTASIYKLTIGTQTILVTEKHPFYVVNKGWVQVKDLEKGDTLTVANKIGKGEILLTKEKLTWGKDVYNIEVDNFHNYYITKDKILVHNK